MKILSHLQLKVLVIETRPGKDSQKLFSRDEDIFISKSLSVLNSSRLLSLVVDGDKEIKVNIVNSQKDGSYCLGVDKKIYTILTLEKDREKNAQELLERNNTKNKDPLLPLFLVNSDPNNFKGDHGAEIEEIFSYYFKYLKDRIMRDNKDATLIIDTPLWASKIKQLSQIKDGKARLAFIKETILNLEKEYREYTNLPKTKEIA